MIALVGAAAQRARGRAADRGGLAAPRPDQPGRRRHRADADGPGRRRRSSQVDLRGQVERLAVLATTHRGTPMVARTLTQHAVPTTFGLKAAQWLAGVLDAYDDARPRSSSRSRSAAPPAPTPRSWSSAASPQELVVQVAQRLGPGAGRAVAHPARRRSPGSATPWSGCTDAWGRIAEDVLTLSRPEIGELSEGAGRRLVDDAAQAQPGAVGAGPPGRPDHADARRDPAPRRRPAGRRARRRRLARRVGDAARPGPPHAGRRLADRRPGRGPRGRPRPDGGDPARCPRAGGRRAVVDGRAGRHAARRSPTSASPPSSSTRSSSAPGSTLADTPVEARRDARDHRRPDDRRRAPGGAARCWCSVRRSAPRRRRCGPRRAARA